jgi:hypothetical protein
VPAVTDVVIVRPSRDSGVLAAFTRDRRDHAGMVPENLPGPHVSFASGVLSSASVPIGLTGNRVGRQKGVPVTTYVITVPGTFLREVPDSVCSDVGRRLRPQDPRNTDLGESEELSVLTREEDGRFAARVEVEAPDRLQAEAEAVRLVSRALRDSGLAEADAPLGPAVVTGIDSEF